MLSKNLFFKGDLTGHIHICIPERFNANITHQLFDYIKTYVNSLHSKTGFNRSFYRFLVYKNKSESQKYILFQ